MKLIFFQQTALAQEGELSFRNARDNAPFSSHAHSASDGLLGHHGDLHGRTGGPGLGYHGLLSNETPFDSGVARGVKRTYVCLDRISGRIGNVLRRNPMARIFALAYMVRTVMDA